MPGPQKVSRRPPPAARKSPARHAGRDDARMLQLIEAAEDIFLQKGFHAATMNDVAKAAGMSKKTVYAMIDSKAELFSALLLHHHSLLKFPVPEPGRSTRDTLHANLLTLARFLLSPGQIAILRLIMAEYTHSPDLGRIFVRSRIVKAKTMLESCLTGLAAAHGMPARDMAAMLFGTAIGEFHLAVLIGYRPAPSKAALETRIRQAVDIFLSSCSKNS